MHTPYGIECTSHTRSRYFYFCPQCFQLKLIKFGNVINSTLLRFLRQYLLFGRICVYECAQFVVLRICEYYTALMATNETPFIQFKMMCVFVTFAYISVLNDKNVHLKRANCKYENTKIKTQTHTEGERAREKKIQT